MNSIPILFSAPMVRAILEGRKTQTRRILKANPGIDQKIFHNQSPYGNIGDQLWVRETWRPSIFMPRAASRITLEVTSIRVERLQDVSESDSIAEGVESWVEDRWKSQPTHYKIYYREPGDESSYSSTAKFSYETLWKFINGPESWDENPWVWVIEFKKV